MRIQRGINITIFIPIREQIQRASKLVRQNQLRLCRYLVHRIAHLLHEVAEHGIAHAIIYIPVPTTLSLIEIERMDGR